ncbi:hypothetical protein Sjap_008314 [Stephania japonica]|uniref:K Homology domain-containing protein n=1 Tax=Stephania japonica TaxID=461633 RepID=A0AAP0JQ36_9MAGN
MAAPEENFDEIVESENVNEIEIENGLTDVPDLDNPLTEQNEKLEHDSGMVGGEKRWPGWPGDSVFRLLVPVQKVGGIIGRKGEFIKRMCEESRARIKILDGPPGTQERAHSDISWIDVCTKMLLILSETDGVRQLLNHLMYVDLGLDLKASSNEYIILWNGLVGLVLVLVSAKEEPDSSMPPAVDGLLRVHKRVVDGLDSDLSNVPPAAIGPVTSRLLVPAAQAGSLIGKQGSTIKSIQESSNCIIRVLGTEDLPVFALQEDRIVEIQGEPTGVHKAVELTASHLRKFLVDRSVIGIFEMQMQRPNFQMEQNVPPHPSWAPPSHGFPQNVGGGPPFGPNPQYMMPPRQHENYYPPAEFPPNFPPIDKQPHQGQSMYGRETSMGVHPSTNMQPQNHVNQVTQHMQVPLSYADAVIGTAGANISYIRRASGATITIQETRGVPGEMTVEINGTASQVQAAQHLADIVLMNFMAEAAGAAQNQPSGPTDNSYQTHGSVFASPQANPGHTNQGAGGYGSGYGTNYGVNYGYQ